MATLIFEQQYRIDSAPPARPLHYWTNCWAWQQDDPNTPDNDIVTTLARAAQEAIPRRTTLVEWRIILPSHIVIWPAGHIETPGLAFDVEEPGPVGQCLLVDFYAAGKRVGYKRFRGPWYNSLQRGPVWDSSLVNYFETIVVPDFMAAPICNRRGVLFDDFRVRPEVCPWQMRHGSKRAARPVFVMP